MGGPPRKTRHCSLNQFVGLDLKTVTDQLYSIVVLTDVTACSNKMLTINLLAYLYDFNALKIICVVLFKGS